MWRWCCDLKGLIMGGNISDAGGLDAIKSNDRLNWEIHQISSQLQLWLLAIIKNNLKGYYAACCVLASVAFLFQSSFQNTQESSAIPGQVGIPLLWFMHDCMINHDVVYMNRTTTEDVFPSRGVEEEGLTCWSISGRFLCFYHGK